MLNWLKTRTEDRCKAGELYGAIVTGARQPAFYTGCGVEDTPEGRYEMIALHLFLVLERLKGEGTEAGRIAQRVMEAFVTDMDDSMREMGVGDLSVGRKVKRSTAGLYHRFTAYRDALSALPPSLDQALAEFVPGLQTVAHGPATLAAYAASAADELASLDLPAILHGQIRFPDTICAG